MTAAHLGLGVIKMNWKQKDRLAQALGFVPYDANYWSRRESMDNFKEALFNRQVVLKDGIAYSTKTERTFAGEDKEEEGKIPKNKVVPAKPENPSMKSLQTMRELPLEEQEKHGVVLAREFAARAHAEREEEMKIFDETMKKVAEERKKKRGSIRRVGARGAGFVDQNANAEMVNKVNNLRRRSSVGGVQVPELKVFAKEVQEKGEFVQEKRRKSSIAMSQQQVEVLSGKSPGGISEEGMKALQEAAAVAQAEQGEGWWGPASLGWGGLRRLGESGGRGETETKYLTLLVSSRFGSTQITKKSKNGCEKRENRRKRLKRTCNCRSGISKS